MIAPGKGSMQMAGDGDEDLGHVQFSPADNAEAGDQRTKGRGRETWIVVHVQAQADQIDAVDTFAQQSGELATIVKDVVRPFETDGCLPADFRGSVADGEAGDERNLVDGQMLFDRQCEGYRETARRGEPLAGSAPATCRLMARQHDGGREEPALFAQVSCMIVCAAEACEPVEAEWPYLAAQAS